MADVGAVFYEAFFKKPEDIIRPHPYTDAPWSDAENYDEAIPPASIDEVLDIIRSRVKKKSCDAHAAVLAGRIGVRYTEQCIDLERRLKLLCDQLEFYAILSVQPVNFSKTEALWSARAIGSPKFSISLGGNCIN
ncbi:unnamed protein product [Didymodactylos carnosus]|uniref:Uncharacterized protein n=2 Tax=Didymodactylos carnosus TaxID=1234261 RepID=A0A8S2FLC5_9BILA|nr:unnamed protein product [Didymodactylos carnosus]CAF4288719.1 unnamed protein product [Didymodactylos carnosus]